MSELVTNKITPGTGSSDTVTLGDSGDTFTIPAGVTLAGSGASLTALPAANLTGTTAIANGGTGVTAVGTSGNVLTSTGSAWASTALPASGSWTLIGTQEASSDSSLTQTGLNSTYDLYSVVVSDMVPATDNKHLWIRLGDSSGIDSGTDYAYHSPNSVSSGSSYGANPSAGDSTILAVLAIGNAAGEGVSGVYYLGKPADGSTRTLVYGSGAGINASGVTVCGDLYASHLSVITHDRVQVLFSSGNIASGRLSVYGLSHT